MLLSVAKDISLKLTLKKNLRFELFLSAFNLVENAIVHYEWYENGGRREIQQVSARGMPR